tara:strand:+ start:246 stop:956 length:711 start_codon:yes stop_codon:yes gene_type:complete
MRDTLLNQISKISHECEVLTSIDSGEESSGIKRQRLITAASGQYVAFLDDDDTVNDDYCKLICEAAVQFPDVVCFNMRMTHQFDRYGKKKIRQETWRLGLWEDNRKKGMMAANHLCAWKKLIAEKVSWCPELGYGDDQLWYGPLHASGIAKTSVFVPQILYEYKFSRSTTANQTDARIAASRYYFGPGLRCFNVDEEILVEDGHQARELIQCRNSKNDFVSISVSEREAFHTVVLR